MVAAGRFITFEGPEGAGKSTQLRLLGEYLKKAGVPVVLTREPGGTPLGARLREWLLTGEALHPRTELLLMAADRAQHVESVIRPALARGEWVLCDRFADSSVAYQGGGLGLAAELVAAANEIACAGLTPDLTFVFLLDPAVGLARKGRTADRIEGRPLDFHQRVYQAYRRLCQGAPERCRAIDVAGLDVAAVHARVLAELRRQGWAPH